MPKTPDTRAQALAALKAQDEAERRTRAELDAATLDELIAAAEQAQAMAQAMEALCADLVSDLSHHALKAQANGGPSVHLGNVLALARQSRAAVAALLTPPTEG